CRRVVAAAAVALRPEAASQTREARHFPEVGEEILDLALEVSPMAPASGHGAGVPCAECSQASPGSWDSSRRLSPRSSGSGTARCSSRRKRRGGSGLSGIFEQPCSPQDRLRETPRGVVHELALEPRRTAIRRFENTFRPLHLRRGRSEEEIDRLDLARMDHPLAVVAELERPAG